METINHTKIKQWIEKTIDVLEAPEEHDLLLGELEAIKRQTRKLERTDGLSSSEKKRVEYIKELLDNVEPEKPYQFSNNPVSVQVLTTVVIVLVMGLGVLTTLYIGKYKSANNLSYQLNTLQKQYKKLYDFNNSQAQSCIAAVNSGSILDPFEFPGKDVPGRIDGCNSQYPTK